MNWKAFVIGCVVALIVLSFAHQPAPQVSAASGTAFVDLTRGNTLQAAEPVSHPAPRRVVVPLVVLDVSSKVAADAGHLVSLDDIARWEELHGHIPPDAVVLARTSLPSNWQEHADTIVGHFPGYSDDAVRFLVEARSVYGLGTDTPNGGRSLVLPYRERK